MTPEHVGGPVAWDCLVRDGALRVVRGRCAVPAGTPVDAEVRARALPPVPGGSVVAGRTAAWLHAGVPDDGVLHLAYPTGRHRPEVWVGAHVWQEPLLATDVVHLAGVPVTTAVRTVVDLAVREDVDVAVAAIRALVEECGVDLDAARRALELRARVVGRPRARRVLAAAVGAGVP
ncbi:hypothetical protein L600_001200000450 [Isoptericola variabilis J7]|nr:hypothetical protein L600_001200000450 [Isoptericola variabilis J7]